MDYLKFIGDYLLYLRKSQTDRDYADASIEETLKRHEATLLEFCKRNKINVPLPPFKEVVSGESLSSRPQMMKVLELISTGKYAGIVCMDIDRLSRGSSLDSGYIMQVLQVNNCKIITPSKTYDLNDESDEQFSDMKFMFARYELRTITKRLVAGRDRSVAEGKYVGSIPPYGYSKCKLVGTKGYSLEIVPDQAKVVQMIYDMYTNERIGYNTIAYRLNQLHLKTQSGREWKQLAVQNVLMNEVYMGKLRWKRYTEDKHTVGGQLVKTRAKKHTYELYDGIHEPIISEEQFALAQQIREQNNTRPVKIGNELRNPFAELLYCGKCGTRLMRQVPPKHRTTTQVRYKCYIEGRGCDCKSHICSEVEEAILTEMRKWFDGYILELQQIEPVKNDDALTTALEMLQKELKDLLDQQNNICELLETKVYTVQMFTKRNATLQADIDKVTEAIADLERQIAEQDKDQTVVENIIPATQKLLENYEDLTVKEKNELWKSVLHRIEYVKEERGGQFSIKIYPKLGQTQ